MLNAVFKLFTAIAIAFGIVYYVTGGDLAQVQTAATKAYDQAMSRKRAQVAIKNAEPTTEPEIITLSVVVNDSTAQPLDSNLRLTGATEASRSVDARAETSGIVAIAPRKGQRVREGDLLCRLELGDRGARRDGAIARLNQAIREADAQKRLSERGFASQNAASGKLADADVLRAEIRQIDVDIKRLEIRAPFDGIVEDAPAEIGSLLQMGGVCVHLVDPDPLRISGYAPEFDIGSIRLGAPATAKLATGENVTGLVAFIAQTADPATRTFEVELEVANPNYALRDAVTAAIEIPLASARAHRLPQSALTLNSDGQIGVMVAEGGKARFRAVKILRDDKDGVWLTGIGERAQVIVVGQEYVSDGTTIKTETQNGSILGGQS